MKHTTSKILHKGFEKKDAHNAISMPVYTSVAFEFETAEAMEAAFSGTVKDHTYSRISNPTVAFLEQRVEAISGAMAVTATASGMAAISNTFLTIAYSGANIVTSSHLFGNTFSLLLFTLQPFGVEVRFCDLNNAAEVAKNIDQNTCAVFMEIVTNPHLEVVDIEKIAAITRKKHVPLVVDSTLIPWSTCRPGLLGADIEVVSATKHISGGATGIGGLIVDHGSFDWTHSPKLKPVAEKFGNKAFNTKLRADIFRNIGACMSPQVASALCLGLETMELRYQKTSENCAVLASFLEELPQVKSVNYNGLPKNKYYEISRKQFGIHPGAMLTFELADKAACFSFMNQLKQIRRATNLFDNKTLIIHPSSTIYVTLPDAYKPLVNIPDNMMRLSVGLENVDDLKADIMQAINC